MQNINKFLLLLLLLAANHLFGQSAENVVIGSMGGYRQSGSINVSDNLGETVSATGIAGTVILTQGFEQPTDNTVGITEVGVYNIKAYPNPAHNQVFVEAEPGVPEALNLSVYDIEGNEVQLTTHRNGNRYEIDFAPLAAASYIISLNSTDGQVHQHIKIQKID